MTVMKTAESLQATYVATSVLKTVSLLKENQDDLRETGISIIKFSQFVF